MSLSMTNISSMQFGTIIFNELYQKDKDSKDYISDRLSVYLLTGQILIMTLALSFGFFIDKFKQWKILLAGHVLIFGAILLFVLNTRDEENIYNRVDN